MAGILPAHAGSGAIHILNNSILEGLEGKSVVLTNRAGFRSDFFAKHIGTRRVAGRHLVPSAKVVEAAGKGGDIDVGAVAKALAAGGPDRVAYVFVVAGVDTELGTACVTAENMRELRKVTEGRTKVVLEATALSMNAFLLRERGVGGGGGGRAVADIAREIVSLADVTVFSGEDELLSGTGGLLAFRVDDDLFRRVQAEVVEYEGLHTCERRILLSHSPRNPHSLTRPHAHTHTHKDGGMAGRDMGVMAVGLTEAFSEKHVIQRVAQTRYLRRRLSEAGIPLLTPAEATTNSVLVDAEAVLPGHDHAHHSLAIAMEVAAGVATLPVVLGGRKVVRLFVPPRYCTCNHLDYVARSLAVLAANAKELPRAQLVAPSDVPSLVKLAVDDAGALSLFRVGTQVEPLTWDMEPWTIRVVESTRCLTEAERTKSLERAGYNTFLIRMEDGVEVDLLTDSGTNAMSVDQWADLARCPEVGSEGVQSVVRAVQDVYGFEHVLPTHQGRMAEFIASQVLIRAGVEGTVVTGNMYFTTTKFHQEFAGATFHDIIVDQAHVASSTYEWKGDIDLGKLRAIVDRQVAAYGSPRMPYISLACPVNMAGGQPMSMANIRATRQYVDECNRRFPNDPILLVLDATRALENAELIREREPGYRHRTIGDVLREICSHFEVATMSSKKDNLVNIGGFLAFRRTAQTTPFYEQAVAMSHVYDGTEGDTSLNARNLAALATGIREMVDERYMHARLMQIRRFGAHLHSQGVPTVMPIGGHAVFIDATRFVTREEDGSLMIPREQYIAQSLAAAIFEVSGVRSMERGAVSKGREKDGTEHFPKLETVRLTIPRRVYLDEQLELAAARIAELLRSRHKVRGLKMVYEPANLRFFQARFKPI